MLTNSVVPDLLGGLNRYVRELSAALVGRGADVTILTKRVDGAHPLEEVGDDGVRLVRYPIPDKLSTSFAAAYPVAVLRGVTRGVRRHGRDAVLHGHFPLPSLVPVALGRPFVQTFHAPGYREVLTERQDSYPLPGALHAAVVSGFRRAEGLVGDRAARCVILSEYTRSELRQVSPAAAERACLIPGGVDLQRFARGPAARPEWARDASPLLFTARRFSPRMGIVQLVEAMPAILERFPAAELALHGSGHLEDEIQGEIDRMGLGDRVRLLGAISDDELVRWYRSADLGILPTQELEGFGLTTVEALACGTPVVGTPAGATPEVLGP